MKLPKVKWLSNLRELIKDSSPYRLRKNILELERLTKTITYLQKIIEHKDLRIVSKSKEVATLKKNNIKKSQAIVNLQERSDRHLELIENLKLSIAAFQIEKSIEIGQKEKSISELQESYSKVVRENKRRKDEVVTLQRSLENRKVDTRLLNHIENTDRFLVLNKVLNNFLFQIQDVIINKPPIQALEHVKALYSSHELHRVIDARDKWEKEYNNLLSEARKEVSELTIEKPN